MTAQPESGNVTIDEVLDCLNHYRLRATYQAVGKLIGCGPRQVGDQLGQAQPRTSWVVRKSPSHGRGLPSPDTFPANQPQLRHRDLERVDHIIEAPEELLVLIAAYKITRVPA